MSGQRTIISAVLLGVGSVMATVFAMVYGIPLLYMSTAMLAGSHGDGASSHVDGTVEEISASLFHFYLVSAIPVTILLLAGSWLREGKEARATYITLAILFYIPLVFGVFAFGRSILNAVGW